MTPIIHPIDWITIKKDLSAISERYLAERRRCEQLAVSKDTVLAAHTEYWSSLASRYAGMAVIVDGLWMGLGEQS